MALSDLGTLQRWTEEIGYTAEIQDASTLRIRMKEEGIVALPPFFVQCTENWVVLSMFRVLDVDRRRASPAGDPEGQAPNAGGSQLMLDALRRLLEVNRDMRVAKFALDERGEVLLCAELPTESLDRSEFADALERIIEYAATYRHISAGFAI
jgi:Tir chaperone protein (CesT) family